MVDSVEHTIDSQHDKVEMMRNAVMNEMAGQRTIEYIQYLESQLEHYKNMSQVNSARAYLSNLSKRFNKIFIFTNVFYVFMCRASSQVALESARRSLSQKSSRPTSAATTGRKVRPI